MTIFENYLGSFIRTHNQRKIGPLFHIPYQKNLESEDYEL